MQDVSKKIYGLDFAVEKSLRYHQRRRAHFDRWHRFVMLTVILFGSAGFGSVLIGWQIWGVPLVAVVSFFSAALAAIDLVFGLAVRARLHEMLIRRFTDLAKQIRSTSEPTKDDYQQWAALRMEIELDEPPILWALEASCDNEVTIAWGRDAEIGIVPISWFQRLFMNYLSFDKSSFPDRKVISRKQPPV